MSNAPVVGDMMSTFHGKMCCNTQLALSSCSTPFSCTRVGLVKTSFCHKLARSKWHSTLWIHTTVNVVHVESFWKVIGSNLKCQWQRCNFIGDSVHKSESCPKFQTQNCCASQGWRHRIESGTQEENQMLSSHAVFCHDIVQSCGSAATRACHNHETCAPCEQSCQWKCQSHWNIQQDMECFCCGVMLTTFKFVQIASASLVKHQSMKVSLSRCCRFILFLVCSRVCVEELLFVIKLQNKPSWMLAQHDCTGTSQQPLWKQVLTPKHGRNRRLWWPTVKTHGLANQCSCLLCHQQLVNKSAIVSDSICFGVKFPTATFHQSNCLCVSQMRNLWEMQLRCILIKLTGPSRKSTSRFWQFTTTVRRTACDKPSQRIQMTASFLHSHQDCRQSTMSAPEELSRMLHSAKPSTQLHRKARDWFWPVTKTVCLANLCLKDMNRHRDSSQITGKTIHLSVLTTDAHVSQNATCSNCSSLLWLVTTKRESSHAESAWFRCPNRPSSDKEPCRNKVQSAPTRRPLISLRVTAMLLLNTSHASWGRGRRPHACDEQ